MSIHVPANHEVETFTGQFVDVSSPREETIALIDIAHALSQTCRYGGHCQQFYSVAEHAVFVSKRLERKGAPRIAQFGGLHHDDSEAYLGDIPRPMKPLLGKKYERMTDRMDAAICEAIWCGDLKAWFHHPEVKEADTWALLVEARFLLPSQGKGWFEGEQAAHAWNLGEQPSRIVVPDYWTGGLSPSRARDAFIARHNELTKGLK